MRPRSVWKLLLGIERAVVEDVRVELEAVVVSVRPRAREKHRCGVCGRRCAREARSSAAISPRTSASAT